MTRNLRIALLCILTMATWPNHAAEVEHLTLEAIKDQGLPFSSAVRVDDMVYMSGAIGVAAGPGIEAQTHDIFAQMREILGEFDADLTNVVKCTVMLADMTEWPAFNDIYVTYFPGDKPARSAFGAAGLAMDARVELECWAALQGDH